MSILLHSGPDTSYSQGARPANPEYVLFAYELTGAPPANYATPVMRRLAAVWRGDGSFEERMMATTRAAEQESPGLWLGIIRSKIEQQDYEEIQARRYFEELQQAIPACTTDHMRTRAAAHFGEEVHAYHRWRCERICGVL